MIRVLIADDHGLVRAGLEQLLSAADDIDVVGAASSGAQAVELGAATSPDVVLMDLSMPEMDGIAATRTLLARAPECQVVVLTSFSDRERIVGRREPGPLEQLTEREREILALIARGAPNKVIGRRLSIAEKTVKNHVSHIFQVIGVTDRTQAALWAREHFSPEDAGSS